MTTRWLAVLATLTCLGGAWGENLCPNPGAEMTDARLPGFALYWGAGQAALTSSREEKHSGASSACLDVTGWWRPADAADTPANRSVNMSLVLAENDGFDAKGAMPGEPGGLYAVSFWYKGDVRSGTVRAIAWPNLEGKRNDRLYVPGLADTIAPTAQWQCFGGTFRLPAEATCFAVQINVSGAEKDGTRLGKLYVDDVRITPKRWPDGEMRAIWWGGPQERRDRAKCLAEAAAVLDQVKTVGFNTVLLETGSLFFEALQRPELQKDAPGSDWDWYGEVLKLATARGLQVHLWYAPWTYKRTYNSAEPRDHPDWRAVYAEGRVSDDAVCFVRPECRQYQLALLRQVLERYPDLAGLHLEEPGHPTCHCAYCAKLAKEWLGLDILADPAGTEASLRNLAAFMNGDFFARLRQMANSLRPEIWLSANGSAGANPDWNIARDWPTWLKRGYIDFYVPQVYTEDPARFTKLARETQDVLGGGAMVTGMAVSWTGIYPRRQDAQNLVQEIRSARQLGAKGFAVFRVGLPEEAHWQAFSSVFKEQP